MTAPTLLDLPVVQDALDYAMRELADWQLVPQRVSVAQGEVRRLAQDASAGGDPVVIAKLTIIRQSLDGVQREYTDAAPLVASVLNAARVAQVGGSVSGSSVTDAAKLATVMAANLGALASAEQAIRDLGGNVSVGPSGGFRVPAWVKWGLIGLGAFWLLRRL